MGPGDLQHKQNVLVAADKARGRSRSNRKRATNDIVTNGLQAPQKDNTVGGA